MPWQYTNPRNITVPVPSSVDTTEARIKSVYIDVPVGGVAELKISVELTGGTVSGGVYTSRERVDHTFVGSDALAILNGGLAAALEQNLLVAMRAVNKLPPGSVA